MDAATKKSYETALTKAEAELANHEQRGEALRQTVNALKGLLALSPAKAPPAKRRAPVRRKKRKRKATNHPPIPSGLFRGMGPTAAYRKFVARFGADHPVPAIRDALLAGGVRTKSATSLLTGIHSVRRRDAMKAKAEGAGANEGGE